MEQKPIQPKTPEREYHFTPEEARDIVRRYEKIKDKYTMAQKIYEKALLVVQKEEPSTKESNTYEQYQADKQALGDKVGDIAQVFSQENLQKMYGKEEVAEEKSLEDTGVNAQETPEPQMSEEKIEDQPAPDASASTEISQDDPSSPKTSHEDGASVAQEPSEPKESRTRPPLVIEPSETEPASEHEKSTPNGEDVLKTTQEVGSENETIKKLEEKIKELEDRLNQKTEAVIASQTPEKQKLSLQINNIWQQIIDAPTGKIFEFGAKSTLLGFLALASGVVIGSIQAGNWGYEKTKKGILGLLNEKFGSKQPKNKPEEKNIEKPAPEKKPEVATPRPEEILAQKKKRFLDDIYTGEKTADRFYYWKKTQKLDIDKFLNPEKYSWEIVSHDQTGVSQTTEKQPGEITLKNYSPENKKLHEKLKSAYEKSGYGEADGKTVEEFLDIALEKGYLE